MLLAGFSVALHVVADCAWLRSHVHRTVHREFAGLDCASPRLCSLREWSVCTELPVLSLFMVLVAKRPFGVLFCALMERNGEGHVKTDDTISRITRVLYSTSTSHQANASNYCFANNTRLEINPESLINTVTDVNLFLARYSMDIVWSR